MASIGFGTKITGRLLGINPTSILGQRKKDGIEAQTPSIGSWRIWARRKAAGKNPDRKRTDCEIAYDRARMDDIRKACQRGFDWSYEWVKERASRYSSAKYKAMKPEEKKEHNKRCQANKKKRWANDPETKARDIARINEWKTRNPEKNRESVRKSNKKRRANNPAYRALCNQRHRFRNIMKSVKNGGTGSYSSKIGCTTKEFHKYMEAKFEPGMTWDNYGTYWHVDHIIPCAAFDQSDPHQVALCWHHSNMQPLEAKENLRKSDKFNEEQLNLLINHTNQEA